MPSLREVQLFDLQILKDVVRVCDNNNIKYMISSGTLLGAVRHGGFIPWDDDIDVDMPLSDYKKFLKLAQHELGEKYFVQNYKTDKNYSEMWTQIRANGTTSMPIRECKCGIHFGIHIDIFPLVGVSNDPKKRNKQKKALALNRMLLHDTYAKALDEPISLKLKLIYAIPRDIRRLICRINEHNIMLAPNKFEDCCEIWYSMDAATIRSTSLIESYISIKFEDSYFNTYSDYDSFLHNMYGDYIIFDLYKDYSEYQREIELHNK